jgi:hypothetical protein
VALGNSGDASRRPVVERLAGDADPVVREHALWALRKLDGLGDVGKTWVDRTKAD